MNTAPRIWISVRCGTRSALAAPFCQLLNRYCVQDPVRNDLLSFDERSLLGTSIELDFGDALDGYIFLGADRIAGGRDQIFGSVCSRCAVDHISVCLPNDTAGHTLETLSELSDGGRGIRVVPLEKLSDRVAVGSVNLSQCEIHIFAPIATVPLFDLFLDCRPLGGIQHIAFLVSDMGGFVAEAEACGVPSLRTEMLKRRSADYWLARLPAISLLENGFLEARDLGGTLRQTFLFPSWAPWVLPIEIVERNAFNGYSEASARVLFEATSIMAAIDLGLLNKI